MRSIKKAQAWGFDLISAITIFIIGAVLFFMYSINYPKEGQETTEVLQYESNFIGESLLSEGYPKDWNENNVGRIGIVDNGRINQTKIERLYAMANYLSNPNGYQKAKSIFDTNHEFFFNLSIPITLSNGSQTSSGVGRNFASQNPVNILKTTRITIYQNNPITLNLYIWN